MTVISTWGRSNMPFQRFEWAIELLYNSVWTGSQWVGEQMNWRQDVVWKPLPGRRGLWDPPVSWGPEKLETRCGRESHHPAERALGTPSEFGDPLVTRCGRESPHPAERAPRPPVEQLLRTRKTQRWWVGVNMLQLCSVSNSLSHTNL